ncbi:unnamed protein product [Ectocarpus sp. CCAP 1310/34]|nr:unnamed protein product [Ectocarpus sp. CCAP 1310/34]
MQPWKTKVVCAGRYRPRQFEYHPLQENVVVFGTLRGEAIVADVASNTVCSSISSGLSKDKHDSILGLCWMKRSPSRFIVGSSYGYLRLCDAGAMPSVGTRNASEAAERAEELLQDHHGDLTSRSNAVQEAMPFGGMGGAENGPGNGPIGLDHRFSEDGRIVTEFAQFEKLTSVHINSTDDQMLASGYTYGVKLFDLGTGQVVRDFEDVHEDHINISRFANHSPFVFATSSFDKTVKAWDSRVRADNAPIYTCHSEMGHVMLSFSPDDVFLLTSAVDNEVKQYLALDGRLHMDLDVPKTGLDENFTRSYYTSSGRLILSGSSEEQTVRLYCAQTGRLIHSAEMYPGRKHGSLYVQSLRGDPHHDFQFSVLVNYRDTAYPLEIVNVDMLQGTGGEDLSSLMAYASSSRLSADLRRACVDKQGADLFLVARDRSRFPAHKAVVACRSAVLGGLLAKAAAAASSEEGKKDAAAGSASLRLTIRSEEGNDCNGKGSDSGGGGGGGGNGGAFSSQEASATKKDAEGGEREDPEAAVTTTCVCLPRAVSPDIVPVILAYLYTDRLEAYPDNLRDGCAKEYVDPGGGCSSGGGASEPEVGGGCSGGGGGAEAVGGCRSSTPMEGGDREGVGLGGGGERGSCGEGAMTRNKVALYEKVLEAAGALGLHRLRSLVEWECRQLVNTTTVLLVASVALRQGTEQLLSYCLHFLGTHLHPVLELHGEGCLPPSIQAKVDEQRRRRVYALHGDPNPIAAPIAPSWMTATTDTMTVPSPPLNPSGQAGAGSSTGAVLRNSAGAGQGGAAAGATNGPQNAFHGLDPTEDDDDDDDDDDLGMLMEEEEGFVEAADNNGGGGNNEGEAAEGDEDYDGFIDEEVDVDDDEPSSDGESLSVDDDDDDDDDDDGDYEGGWMDPYHGGGKLPAIVRKRIVPTVTGHTATAVLGSRMMVLGGGNIRQFHSCRHVLVYDPIERTWSKLDTRGNAPSALIYHSTTALEPPWGAPRNLLVCGGNTNPRNINAISQTQVSVLDCLTMEWHRPKVEGDPIGVRTRHTAVAVHADYEHHRDRVNVNMSQPDELAAEEEEGLLDADDYLLEGKGCGKRREIPGSPAEGGGRSPTPPRDFGGDTNIIIFGGFSPIAGHAFNDVVVVNVHRPSTTAHPSGRSTGGGDTAGALPSFHGSSSNNSSRSSSSSKRSQPARRRRRSSTSEDGAHPVVSEDDNNNNSDDDDGGREANGGGSNDGTGRNGYTYRWVYPVVRGTPPVGRLAHSAAVVRLVEGEGGGGRGSWRRQQQQQAYMVVFGGVGTGSLFNDVHCLRCSSGRTLEWEKVFVRGRRPARRYGHSMVPLTAPSGTCGYAKLVLFGGTSGHHAFNDMFLLNLSWGTVDGQHGILAKWESLATQITGVLPSPRSRQTVCQLNGELIIFGGSNETRTTINGQPASREVDAVVFHVRPRLRKKLLAPSQGYGAEGGAAGLASSLKGSPPNDDRAVSWWYERAMAKEVYNNAGLVEAAQQRRAAEAARAAAAALDAAAAERRQRDPPAELFTGPPPSGVRLPMRAETPWRDTSRGWGGGAGAAAGGAPATAFGTFGFLGAAASVARGGRLRRPQQQRGGGLSQPPPSLQEWPGEAPTSVRPYRVKVVWECIRPDTFVYEPGPEPPVVVRPMTLHKDMQTLIDNDRFSDIKFRFQAVDFALPTTPTNTAHYAIVPPPSPPPPGISPLSPPAWSRSPRPAGGNDVPAAAAAAPSKLPEDPGEPVGLGRGSRGDASGNAGGNGWKSRSGRMQSVVMRSSAGREWESSR